MGLGGSEFEERGARGDDARRTLRASLTGESIEVKLQNESVDFL